MPPSCRAISSVATHGHSWAAAMAAHASAKAMPIIWCLLPKGIVGAASSAPTRPTDGYFDSAPPPMQPSESPSCDLPTLFSPVILPPL